MSGEAPSLEAHAGVDLAGGVGGKVREPAVFEIAPEEFHGVDIRRIGRKPDDVAARMSGQPGPHERVLVRAAAIPQQDEGTAHMAGEMAKKAQDLRTPNVAARVQGQGQHEVSAARRHDEGADAGDLLVRARGHGQRRRRAAWRPGPAEHRHHQESRFIEADQMGAEVPEFFYPGPIVLNPLAHSAIVALLGPRLRPLRTEATRPEQPADVIGMVDDLELLPNQIDDPAARPQARAIAGGFRPGDDHARESPPLRRRELRRSTGRRACAQAGATLSAVRPVPSTDRAPIDAQALGDDMNGEVTLEQFNRAESSPLELSRAPLWAHVVPPTGKHSVLGPYLHTNH